MRPALASSRILPTATLLTLLLIVGGCIGAPPAPIQAERAVLEREMESLTAYLEEDLGEVLAGGDLLVAVHEDLVADLLETALPASGDLSVGYRIRLDAARVEFRTGLALVRLEGRASLLDRPATLPAERPPGAPYHRGRRDPRPDLR